MGWIKYKEIEKFFLSIIKFYFLWSAGMFSFDLSDLRPGIIYHLVRLVWPAHPFSVFCPDWPHMIDLHKNLLCTCQSCIDSHIDESDRGN